MHTLNSIIRWFGAPWSGHALNHDSTNRLPLEDIPPPDPMPSRGKRDKGRARRKSRQRMEKRSRRINQRKERA